MARPIPDMDQMTAAEVAVDDSIIIDDTSAGETKRINVGDMLGLPDFGWTPSGQVWTYASATTITVPNNATTKYSAGMLVKVTQSTGGTKYGVITGVASTVLTVSWLNGATLANETITTPFYSSLATPYGFGTINHAQLSNGTVVQVVTATTGAVLTGTTPMNSDDTIPQNNEGTEFLTITITPKSATNKLIVDGILFGSHSQAAEQIIALFQGSAADAIAVAQSYGSVGTEMNSTPIRAVVTAGGTSAITFKIRAGGHNAGTFTINGQNGARKFGGIIATSLKVTEVKA